MSDQQVKVLIGIGIVVAGIVVTNTAISAFGPTTVVGKIFRGTLVRRVA